MSLEETGFPEVTPAAQSRNGSTNLAAASDDEGFGEPGTAARSVELSDGRRLGFSEFGDTAGAPIFYFHGGLSCRLDIAFADVAATGLGVRLIAADRPGMGLSDRQPGRHVLDWTRDVAQLAAHLGIERCSVLGWSAGGPYALACGLKLTDLVVRVGTAGGMAPFDSPEMTSELGLRTDRIMFPLSNRAPRMASVLLSAAKRQSPGLIKANLIRELTSRDDKATISELTDSEASAYYYEALRYGTKGVVDDYRALGRDWGFRPEEIRTEVILWQGDEDQLLPMAHARFIADRLPNGRLRVVPGKGHYLLRSVISDVLSTLAVPLR